MALFRRRSKVEPAASPIDYDELAKAIMPAIAAAAGSASGGISQLTPAMLQAQLQGNGALGAFAPLPRADQFVSQFGPGMPLIPEPLDQLTRDGRTMPRRSEFLVSWNLQLVDRQVPWTMLRWLAEECDVINRCVQLKQDEIVGAEWDWGFSKQILNQIMIEDKISNPAKATQMARDKYGSELTRVQQFFEQPDKDMGQTFSDWMVALIWDHLVYDGVCVYPHYNLGGDLRNLELVDASTIKVLRDNRGRIPLAPAPAYQQILYGFPRGEFLMSQDDAGDTSTFANDQLAYYVRRGRSTSVYGYPQVENAMSIATTYLARQAWMRAEYTMGATPTTWITTDATDSWTPEQMNTYEQLLNDKYSGQIERRQLMNLLRQGMDVKFSPRMDETYKADYDNWLISQMGSRFGVAANTLGVQAKSGLSGGKQMEGEMEQVEMYSTKALVNWLIDVINDLARRYLGVGLEITATCNLGNSDEDEVMVTQSDVALVGAGIATRNEIRNKRHMPTLDMPEADELGVTTATGVTYLTGTLASQESGAQLAASMAEQGRVPGQPSQEDEDPQDGGSGHQDGSQPPSGFGSGNGSSGSGPSAAAEPKPTEQPKADGESDSGGSAAKKAEGGETDDPKVGEPAEAPATSAPPTSGALTAAFGVVLADRIVDHYAGDVSQALSAMFADAPQVAQQVAEQYPDPTMAAAAVADFGTIIGTPDTTQLADVVDNMYWDGVTAGQHVASERLKAVGVAPPDAVHGVNEIDWSSWKAGDTRAAAQVANGGLVDNLKQAGQRITGISQTQYRQIAQALQDGITRGDNGRTIGAAIADIVGDEARGMMIARTEVARAMEQASASTYGLAGISQWSWLADDNACPVCLALEDGGPYDLADPLPPEASHPNCRCASIPHVEDQ
jgi:SPP1 gp7 family putative phage head morphogenesis protein